MSTIALILAGGGSRRMGRDKLQLAWAESGSHTVLDHVVGVARGVADKVCVLMPPTDAHEAACIEQVLVIRDEGWFCGPLKAIATAWPGDMFEEIFVVAGDLPGVTTEVLRACQVELRKSPAIVNAAVVRRQGRPQPLLGCYRWQAGQAIRAAAADGEPRMMAALDKLCLQYLEAEQWPEWWTKPIHTPDDYAAWLERARESK